jgi:hypothetical protein
MIDVLSSQRRKAWEALRALRSFRWALLRLALVIAFVAVRWNLSGGREPVVTGDGHIWLRVAHEPIFSTKFWLGPRPATLSLVYKLVGGSDQALVLFQTGLGTLSWVILAAAVSAFFSTPLFSALALALIFSVGLTTPVLCWDAVIRSESVGLSTFILCFAAVLGIARSSGSAPSRWRLNAWTSLAVVSAALTAFARETNAYLLPLLAVLVVVGAVGRFSGVPARARLAALWRRPSLVALSFVVISLACQLNTRASGRYAFSLMNVIFMRVLPSSSRLTYFRERLDMPVSAALLARRSRWASADDRAAFRSPELAEFRRWLHERGYSAYDLLAHSISTWGEAERHFAAYVRADFARAGPELARDNVADAVLVHGPLASFPRAFLPFFGLAGVALAFTRSRRTATLAAATVFSAVAAVVQTYVCYHGDAMELERHGMLIGTLVRLAAVFTVLAAASAAEQWKKAESPASEAGSAPYA